MPSVNKTQNYGLNQWQGNEYPKREDFVADNVAIDEALSEKLDKTGNSKDNTVTFEEASARAALVSNDKHSVLFGKVKKWLSDLKSVAFSGNLSDLTQDSSYQTVTAAEKTTWNSKANGSHTHTSSGITDFLSSVLGSVLTGLSTGSSVVIAATDTIKNAFEKLQAQVSLVASSLTTHAGNINNPHNTTAAQTNAVPTSRTVNGKALSGDISLTASDVGAAKLYTGAYVGNGLFGSSNPVVINCPFTPKSIRVYRVTSMGTSETTNLTLEAIYPQSVAGCLGFSYMYGSYSYGMVDMVTWGANSVSWYSQNPDVQLNTAGKTYAFEIFG